MIGMLCLVKHFCDGWEPWSSGYGRRLTWVCILAPYPGRTIFAYLFVVKFVMSVWKDQNKWKKRPGWPILCKNIFCHHWGWGGGGERVSVKHPVARSSIQPHFKLCKKCANKTTPQLSQILITAIRLFKESVECIKFDRSVRIRARWDCFKKRIVTLWPDLANFRHFCTPLLIL